MRCPACDAESPGDARFCGRCGASLVASAETRPPFEAGEAGDRRVVTALFADLVDYVRMVAERDPEEVRQRVRAALAVMAEVIVRYGGTREKFIGDAVFAVFGWPRAHDDDAIRAALAGLGIRAALRSLDGAGEPLDVRIGIATGEVVTTSRADPASDDLALTGAAITTAARIQSLARPGEILLDAATVAAARGRLLVADRGAVVLRGQSEPVGLRALEGDIGLGGFAEPRPRQSGRLIGRGDEVDRIGALLERAIRTGMGGVLLVEGEAGIGKSRLLAEAEALARAAGFACTAIECTSYGQTDPYRFSRIFAQELADEHGVDSGTFARTMLFTQDVDPADVRRLGGAIAAIARDADFTGWEAESHDTPTDPGALTSALLEVAERYLARVLQTAGPRVVAIDDLHWMDPSSVGLVEVLIAHAGRDPLVVIAGMRPGEAPAWVDRPWVERIELQGLAMSETAQLVTEIARAALDADDARRIHERTAGNPLFVTETVRAFLEDGTLAWHDGRVSLAEGPMRGLPVTLRAVLGARIDALAPDAREVLGVASVMGIRFDVDLVGQLTGSPVQLRTMDRLVQAGLVVPDDDGPWRFSHPLIHDTAYAGVLASRRRRLHGLIADALEDQANPATRSLIAMHRAASGDPERAIPLLDEAGATALVMGAPTEAASFWRTAADLAADPAVAEAYRSRAAAALGEIVER